MARKGKGKFEGGDQRGKEVRKGIGGEGENMVENWRSRKSESEAGMRGGGREGVIVKLRNGSRESGERGKQREEKWYILTLLPFNSFPLFSSIHLKIYLPNPPGQPLKVSKRRSKVRGGRRGKIEIGKGVEFAVARA